MTADVFVRGVALVAGVLLGLSRGPRGRLLALVLLPVAAIGTSVRPLPGPSEAAAVFLVLAALVAALERDVWPPIVGDSVGPASLLCLASAAAATASVRGVPAATTLAAAAIAAAAMAVFAGEATRASAEAGWRRALGWALAIAIPSVVAAGGAALLEAQPFSRHGLLAAAACVLILLAYVPAGIAEWRRTVHELREEVEFGILPAQDANALALPWRRARTPWFGRADERREYVRSALLLAVARRQQTRRDGEEKRLRQLEVLAFRTRLRRTLEARNARISSPTPSSGEFPLPETLRARVTTPAPDREPPAGEA